MDDTAMEATVGQAFIEMDSNTLNGNQFSRVTFGQDVKVQANADSLDLGAGYNGGTDFSATNLSLGYINTTDNSIVPFEFTNPYFEWVTDASNNMVGFRVGADQTIGKLQMDLTSFSGHIDMIIDGQAAALFTGAAGTQTNSRATYIGDSTQACVDGTSCVSLANIQSLDVADSDGSSTGDFFLSFQKTSLNWLLSDNATERTATKGFFMNIPTNNNITISGTGSGTAGYAVEFIDRGVGRWNN